MTSFPWVVVVPVKPAARGKSRLAEVVSDAGRAELVRAMALDTIAAARAAAGVARVVVVTADEPLRAALPEGDGVPVSVVDEPTASPDPLNAALRRGAQEASLLEPGAGVAALLGDLPALRAADLAAALDAATGQRSSFVPDASGAGTTLLAVRPGTPFEPRFGAGSARAHADAGHVELPTPPSSSLRRDVDVPDDLREVERHGVGPSTAAWLERTAVDLPR